MCLAGLSMACKEFLGWIYALICKTISRKFMIAVYGAIFLSRFEMISDPKDEPDRFCQEFAVQ